MVTQGCVSRLIVRCPGQRARVLRRGVRWLLGRSAGNHLVVEHPTVSRSHAQCGWEVDGALPWVEDRGSANGVWLDAHRVHGACLIEPGSHELRLGEAALWLELHPQGDPRASALIEDDTDSVLLPEDARPEYRGQIGGRGAICRLLMRLEGESRTGTLRVEGEERVEVVLCAGRVVRARCGPHRGAAALRRLLDVCGEYRFTRRVAPEVAELDLAIGDLLAGAREETGGGATTRRLSPEVLEARARRDGSAPVRPPIG